MATDEKLDEKEEGETADEPSDDEKEEAVALEPTVEPKPVVETRPDENGPAPTAPIQLGYRRYVYAAYMAGAIAVAFLSTKVIDYAWFKTAQWKPQWFGMYVEPVDEAVVIAGGIIGIGTAIYYWRNKKVPDQSIGVCQCLLDTASISAIGDVQLCGNFLMCEQN